METRSEHAGWMRRLSWRLGAALATLGKRLARPTVSVPISAVILARSNAISAVSPDQSMDEVAHLLVKGRCEGLPVIDHGRAIGMVTRDAVAGALATAGAETPVGLVTLSDVVVVSPTDPLEDVLERLDAQPGAVALVLDHGAPVGLVTREQLDAYLASA